MYQQKAEKVVQEARRQVEKLVGAYKNGEPINLDNVLTPTPSQKVLLILNSIVRDLCQWKSTLEQSGQDDILQGLQSSEKKIKDKLKHIREAVPASSKPLNIETDISSNTELDNIQNQCNDYVAQFESLLSKYELDLKVDEAKYIPFIEQLIKDQIFNYITRFISFDPLPEKLDDILQLVDWEMVPIEIGITETDTRMHDIQGAQQTGVKPGTIAKVILPGLRQKTDGVIVQKPVVIRGE